MPIPIETAHVPAFDVPFFRFGRGEKTMVILPGLSVQSVMLAADAVAETYGVFADTFTVYLFDRRVDLPARYTVADMAADTARAIDALGLSDVYLFGASQGGMMALELAARRPDLVRRLAVASTPLCVDDDSSDAMNSWIDAAKQGDGAALYLSFARAVYPSAVFEEFKKAFAAIGRTLTQHDLARFITLAEGAHGFDFRTRTGEIRCPVFAAAASDDAVLGESAVRATLDAFGARSDSVCHLYSSYGHALYDVAPDFKQRLFSFFTADGSI